MSNRDIVGVVEAAYALQPDELRWLEGLLDAATGLLSPNPVTFAFTYDARDPAKPVIGSATARGMPPSAADSFGRTMSAAPPSFIDAIFPRAPFYGRASKLAGSRALRSNPFDVEKVPAPGVVDAVAAVGACGDGFGVLLGHPVLGPLKIPARRAQAWSRVAVHLATAYRLRRALAAGGSFDLIPGAEAVLEPGGELRHAEGPARSGNARAMLRRRVKEIDRARGAFRRQDPAGALGLWRALVDARWTLVDHFESDGRRFVVARRNTPELAGPRALTLRERQVATYVGSGHSNKLTAYELGISEGTVASTLATAMVKLGVGSRVELVRLAALDPAFEPSGAGPAVE